jgi:hypothetical protein
MSNEISLNDDERELEAALRSLPPAPARLNVTAAKQAAANVARRRQRRRWQLAAAAALVAGLPAWAVWPARQPAPEIEPRVAVAAPSTAVQLPPTPPTIANYRLALMRSSAEFESMLARQAITRPAGAPQPALVNSLSLYRTKLDSPFLGDL